MQDASTSAGSRIAPALAAAVAFVHSASRPAAPARMGTAIKTIKTA